MTAGERPLLDDGPEQIAKLQKLSGSLQRSGLQQTAGLEESGTLTSLPPVQAIAPGVVQYNFEVQGTRLNMQERLHLLARNCVKPICAVSRCVQGKMQVARRGPLHSVQ